MGIARACYFGHGIKKAVACITLTVSYWEKTEK